MSYCSWLRLWSMLFDVIYTASESANKWKVRLAQCRNGENSSLLTALAFLPVGWGGGEHLSPETTLLKASYITDVFPGAVPQVKGPNWSTPALFNGIQSDKGTFLNPLDQLNTHCLTSMQYSFCWGREVGPFKWILMISTPTFISVYGCEY